MNASGWLNIQERFNHEKPLSLIYCEGGFSVHFCYYYKHVKIKIPIHTRIGMHPIIPNTIARIYYHIPECKTALALPDCT